MYNCAKICKKSTPKQKMLYQISLKLYKLMKEIYDCCTFEHVTLADQIICTRRQSTFEIHRSYSTKIGLNTLKIYFITSTNLLALKHLA